MTIELGILLSILGGFFGLAGWLAGRDKKIESSALWRGEFAAKLDSILASVTGLRGDVDRLDARMNEYGERLATVEASARQAHRRLDEMRKGE